MSDVTFGSEPTFERTGAYDISVSEDGKAFTLRFTNMAIAVDPATVPLPIAARTFCLALPVNGGDGSARIAFGVSGYAVTTPGTNGYVVLGVNGKTSIANFAADRVDEDFVLSVDLDAGPVNECRISLCLVVERDSREAAATLAATTIDAEIKN